MSAQLKRLLIGALTFIFLLRIPEDCSAQQFVQSDQGHTTNQSETNAGKVTIESLVDDALNANPEIAVMRREFDAARARIPQAKALPDPVIMIGNINTGSPIPFLRVKDDFNENFNLGVSQDFPWFGIRRLRGLVAGAEADAKFQEYTATVRRLTAEVKSAAYDLYFIDRSLAVIKRDIDILDKTAKVAEARYSVGKAQQVDVINARLEITDMLDKQGNLEAKRISAEAKLNNLLFRDPTAPIAEIADVHMSLEPPPLEELIRLAQENSPDINQQKRLIESSNHSLRLAEREAKYPEVGFLFQYHNRTPDFPAFYNYQISLKLPLYAFKKQRYAIEEQSADLAAARSRLAAVDSTIRYKLRDARVRTEITARLIRLHEQGLIPQSTLALESALSAYQVGQVDFLTLLTALKRALDYETHYYEMLSDYQKALAEMEVFAGIELTR